MTLGDSPGYLFGLVLLWRTVLSWVFISISQYGNGPVVAVLVTAAFVSLLFFPWGVAYHAALPALGMDAMALWAAAWCCVNGCAPGS